MDMARTIVRTTTCTDMLVWCAVPAVAEMSTFNFEQFVLLLRIVVVTV